MDAQPFDAMVRQLTTARSRRRAFVALLAGTFGLVALSTSEAKHHKKKKKKKGGSPPASPPGSQCPARCPVCQECSDGRSCTVQSDFTLCENSACKECKSGVCVTR